MTYYHDEQRQRDEDARMMTPQADIVERLRDRAESWYVDTKLDTEAADIIEKHRAAIEGEGGVTERLDNIARWLEKKRGDDEQLQLIAQDVREQIAFLAAQNEEQAR